jgi:ubiquitin-protein ligase
MDLLKYNWSPVVRLLQVLECIHSIMIDPFTDEFMMPEIGLQYHQKRAEFNATAQ